MKNEKIEELKNLERITKRGMWWIRLDRARDIVTEAYEQCKKDEREHWMNQPDNEHDQAIRKQLLDEIMEEIKAKTTYEKVAGGGEYSAGFNDAIEIIKSKY